MESPAKLANDTTTETIIKEGIKKVEKADVDVAAECKAQESVKNGSGDAPEITKNGTSPTKPAQNNTVAQDGKDEDSNGDTPAPENSANGEEKAAPKRPAEEQAEEVPEVDEPKKQKTEEKDVEENNGDTEETDPAAAE